MSNFLPTRMKERNRKDGRKKFKQEGGKKRKERQRTKEKKEEIWGLAEDTSLWPLLLLLVHGSLQ